MASALEELTKSEREALPLIMERLEQQIGHPGRSGSFAISRAKFKIAQCWLGVLSYDVEIYPVGELAMRLRRAVANMIQGDFSGGKVGDFVWLGAPDLGHVRVGKVLTAIAVMWIDQDVCEDVIES